MMTSKRDTDTVRDKLASSDSNRLYGDHGSAESGRGQLPDVDGGDSSCGSDP